MKEDIKDLEIERWKLEAKSNLFGSCFWACVFLGIVVLMAVSNPDWHREGIDTTPPIVIAGIFLGFGIVCLFFSVALDKQINKLKHKLEFLKNGR